MKNISLSKLLILSILVVLISACNRSGKSTSETKEIVEVEVFDAVEIKNEIVKIIQEIPDTREIAEMVKKAGASYILDLTVPIESAEKMLTSAQIGMGMGMYAFDMQYANVYNRTDMVNSIVGIQQQLVVRVGVENELVELQKYVDRLTNNANNTDSVDFLVTTAMNEANRQLASSDRADIYAYNVIGGNVEAMYVMSQLALLANDNTQLLALIGEQRSRIKTMFSLFELMSSDPGIKPVYEGLLPIFQIFENNETITQSHLEQMTPVIENVRNKLI